MSNPRPTIDLFLQQFESEFEEEEAGTIQADTPFRDLEEWSSMQALVVNLFIHENYGVNLTTEDYKKSQTVGDLYQIVLEKMI